MCESFRAGSRRLSVHMVSLSSSLQKQQLHVVPPETRRLKALEMMVIEISYYENTEGSTSRMIISKSRGSHYAVKAPFYIVLV